MKKDLSITPKGVEILKEKETHLDTKKISDKWMGKYALAKKYYEHYGSLEMPAKFKTKNGVDYDDEGVQLGRWIHNQRQGIKGLNTCKINSEQIKLLEEIGMKWFADNKDYKLQNEIINEDNIKRKQIEMRNRFYSVLNSFEDKELPTKEELNNKLLCKLNHRK